MATTDVRTRNGTVFPENDQRWWRFSAYEIREDRIQPAPGATLETYALPAWQEAGRAGRSRAHEALVLALPKMDLHESGWPVKRKLSEDEERKILDFCTGHGLLGLLHHQVRSIALTPRERLVRIDHPVMPVFTVPYQVRHTRTTIGWRETSREWVPHDRPDPGVLDLRHELVVDDEITDECDEPGVFEPPRALVQPLGEYDEEAVGLEDSLWPYFPSVPADDATTFPYPPPDGELFWRMYAEPVGAFLRAAFLLSRVFETLPAGGTARARAELDSLVAPVGLVVDPVSGGPPVQRLRAPSLLAALALEAISTAAAGRRLVRCQACNALFFSDNYQAVFCSPTHARRIRTRNYRERKAAMAQKPQGRKA